jgi:hypothetical protein
MLSIFNRGRNNPFRIAYEKSEAEVFIEFARRRDTAFVMEIRSTYYLLLVKPSMH